VKRICVGLVFFFVFFPLLKALAVEGANIDESTPHGLNSQTRSPYLAGLLAEVFPGAGYLYQGDYSSALLSSSLILPMAAQSYVTTPSFITKSIKSNLGTLSRNLFGYTVYDSFQSAMTDEDRLNQIVPIPHYRFSELYFAPFRGDSYSSWKMWVPVGMVGISVVSKLATYGISPKVTPVRALVAIPIILAQTFMIGVGEESEFRGFQYPAFSQLTRSRAWGNVFQSVSFGLCHTRWGVCASPYLTGQLFRATNTIDPNTEYFASSSPSDGGNTPDLQYLFETAVYGIWWGWMVQSEENGLLKTITSHALVDALLVVSDLLTTNNTGRFYLSMSVPVPLL